MTGPVDLSRAVVLAAVLASLAAPAVAQTRYPYSLTLYDQPDYRGGSVTFYGDNANIGSTGFSTRARSAQIRGTWRLCEGGGYRNRCEVLNLNIRDLEAYGFSGRVGSAQLLGAGAQAIAPPPAAPPARYDPPAYAAAPYAPPPAAPYRPAPHSAAPAATPPSYLAPPYLAPYASGPYEAPPETLPPAVDAPLSAPSRFGRAYDAPAAASAPPVYSQPAYPPSPYPPASRQPVPAAAPYGDGSAQGPTTVFFPSPTIRGADVAAWTPRAADGFCRAQGLGAAVYFDQSQRLPRAVDIEGRPVGEGPVLRDLLCRR